MAELVDATDLKSRFFELFKKNFKSESFQSQGNVFKQSNPESNQKNMFLTDAETQRKLS